MTTRRIRFLTAFFVIALVLSGLTAFPILISLRALSPLFDGASTLAHVWPDMANWMATVLAAYEDVYGSYPFIGYGTDWLAFSHLVIAGAFWGVWKEPVRNVWVVEWAMWACVAVLPLAIICGPIRGIPWFWTMVDCSFGVIGFPILWRLRREILELEVATHRAA